MGTYLIPTTRVKTVDKIYHVYQSERLDTIVDKVKVNRHYLTITIGNLKFLWKA